MIAHAFTARTSAEDVVLALLPSGTSIRTDVLALVAAAGSVLVVVVVGYALVRLVAAVAALVLARRELARRRRHQASVRQLRNVELEWRVSAAVAHLQADLDRRRVLVVRNAQAGLDG
jgi:hypothetical protein